MYGPFVKTIVWSLPLLSLAYSADNRVQAAKSRQLEARAQTLGPTPIRTCTTIGASGSYQVVNPISGNNCLTITGGAVNLSCATGAIIGNVGATLSHPALAISNASVSITGCTIQITGTSQNFINSPVSAVSSTLTLTGDTVIGGETYLQQSNTTINQGAYETLQVSGGSATFNNNPSFTATPNRGYVSYVVSVNSGAVLTAHSGTLAGNWSGKTAQQAAITARDGVDDILLLDHVGYGGTIRNMTLSGAFDMGVENIGPLTGWMISDNQLSRMGYGCIGGWYASSWDGNNVQRNTCHVSASAVSSTPRLFSWAYYQWGGAFDPIIYFRNNNITDNSWVPDSTVRAGYALWVDPTYATAYKSTLVASNNIFARNTFRSSVFVAILVHLLPAAAILDGGGNTADSVKWPDQPAPYPLQFQ